MGHFSEKLGVKILVTLSLKATVSYFFISIGNNILYLACSKDHN